MDLLVPGVFICVLVALTIVVNRFVTRQRPDIARHEGVPEPDEYFRRGKHTGEDDVPDPAFVEEMEREGKVW